MDEDKGVAGIDELLAEIEELKAKLQIKEVLS